MIKTLRVDERLIHGQVAVTWCGALSIDRIVVANDKSANDEVSVMSLQMAAPQNVKVAVKSVADSVKLLTDPRLARFNVLVLVNNPFDALTLVEKVKDIPYVNVGNFGLLKKDATSEMISTSFAVNDKEKETFKKIAELKPDSTYQMTPTLPIILLKNLIEGKGE